MCKIIPKPASVDAMALAKELYALASKSFFNGSPWTIEQFADDLTYPESHYFLCYAATELIGFISFRQFEAEVEILEIAVAPEFRRQGIAQELWQHLRQSAEKTAQEGVRFLLEVRASNDAAQALYKRLGFQVVAKRQKYYHHPVEDAWVMVKEKEEQHGTGEEFNTSGRNKL